MNVEFQTCIDRDIIYMKWTGVVDFDTVMGGLAAVRNDENYRPGRPRLVDASRITEIDMDYGLLRAMVREKTGTGDHSIDESVSAVYAPGDVVFGVTRMVQTMMEIAGGARIDVFRVERDALASLGLGHESFADLLATENFLAARPGRPSRAMRTG
ncbi:hypothetical protein KUL25_18170 [Rhodobacteraceae bacterium N5(2021)]|uniref:Uncharacterized protein n=1 Tax=Gymnodinialimonas phycosphaerae TaxID=2841589 RepID=A0A975TTV4_9RHOB|nr:hypothetical protein [Gymnodinialimonas phycosphaerae]MBY4894690.1 hypothetical protein [Gymnodinialimonas phycosphaerae]